MDNLWLVAMHRSVFHVDLQLHLRPMTDIGLIVGPIQWSLTYPDTSIPRLTVWITEFPNSINESLSVVEWGLVYKQVFG